MLGKLVVVVYEGPMSAFTFRERERERERGEEIFDQELNWILSASP
jgi:hypothetical protein